MSDFRIRTLEKYKHLADYFREARENGQIVLHMDNERSAHSLRHKLNSYRKILREDYSDNSYDDLVIKLRKHDSDSVQCDIIITLNDPLNCGVIGVTRKKTFSLKADDNIIIKGEL